VNRDEDTIIFGIVGGCIGAIFFWLVRRLRKEFNFKNISSIFLAFFGYAAFNLGSFAAEERWSVIAIKLAIYLPILVVLYRATKAVAYLNKVKE
jgi:H+/Cl- antiporter ClcA